MHKNRSKSWLSLILCLIALSFSFGLFAEEVTAENTKIENFVVEDVPNDQGNGLLLKWTPLSNKLKILEYRVYRGVTPDSLFYSGSVVLNPVVGFAGEEITYLDSGFKPFVDKSSPGRLTKDKKVVPLDEYTNYFGTTNNGYPRDLEVLKQVNGKFTLLAQIDKGIYYSRFKPVDLQDNKFAGYPLGNTSVLARLKEGEEYFYSVVPINENRRYFSPSEVVSGKPVKDPILAPAKEIYASVVLDGDKPIDLNFDWDIVSGSKALQQAIYVFEEPYEIAKSYFETSEEIVYNGNQPLIIPLSLQDNAYGKLSLHLVEKDSVVYISNDSIENYVLDIKNLSKYSVAIQSDAYNERFISENKNEMYQHIFTQDKANTPRIPTFEVNDLPNDKGDTQLVVWEKPTIEITKTSFNNKLGSFLIVNYDYFDSEAERLKEFNLKLTVEGKDEAFVDHNEFYLNNIIKKNLPEDYNNETIIAEITVTTNNKDTEPYVFVQKLEFNSILKALTPSSIVKDGIKLNSFNYEVYAKNAETAYLYSNAPAYLPDGTPAYATVTAKVVGKMNNYSDVLSYERAIYEPIIAFDTKSNRVLIPTDIQVWFDSKVEKALYLDKFVDNSKASIAEQVSALEAELETVTDAQYESLLTEYLSKVVALQTTLESGISQSKWIKLVRSYRNESLRQRSYKVFTTNNKGLFASYELPKNEDGTFQYFTPISNQFDKEKWAGLIASIVFAILVGIYINLAKKGTDLYIRPIAGIQEIDNAIGRATEMGRPILFVPGMSSISVVATLAALSILGKVAKKAAEYDTRILVPTKDYILMPIAQEIVKEAHIEAGRPDTFDKNSVFFITTDQFAYVAGVNGIMIREKTATNFYMGSYFAESLLMTETGNITGAIQIAGTDSVTQIPFFITTCDYTLIGEELYAASAYMSKDPMILGTLKAQDYFKFIILFFIIVGTILSTSKITFLLDIFPEK